MSKRILLFLLLLFLLRLLPLLLFPLLLNCLRCTRSLFFPLLLPLLVFLTLLLSRYTKIPLLNAITRCCPLLFPCCTRRV